MLVTLSAAILFDVLGFGMRRPDLYNPEREALIEAQWQLAQSVPHGPSQTLQDEQTEATQRHIHTALGWLEKAAGVRADHRQRITTLRAEVEELEAADRAARASATHRARVYAQIAAELKTLIKRYKNTPPALAAHGQT